MNEYWINLCNDIQAASDREGSQTMYSLIKTALGPNITKLAKLKTVSGEPTEDQVEQLKKWVGHYSKLYAEYIPEHPDLESVLTSFHLFFELDKILPKRSCPRQLIP